MREVKYLTENSPSLTAPEPPQNAACSAPACGGSCANGVNLAAHQRTAHNQCGDCNWEYYLSNKRCHRAHTDEQYARALNNERLSMKSHHGKYVVAEPDGKANANRPVAGGWETWTLQWLGGTTVAFKGAHNKYLVAEPTPTRLGRTGNALANRHAILGSWEKFTLDKVDGGRITLKGAHGKYLVAEPNGELNIDRTRAQDWEKFRVYKRP